MMMSGEETVLREEKAGLEKTPADVAVERVTHINIRREKEHEEESIGTGGNE